VEGYPVLYESVDDLLALASDRTPMNDAAGKSGARLERLTIDGQPHVLKRCWLADDWTMHASGVIGGPPLALWRSGLLQRLPACINQPVVAMSIDDGGRGAALLMPDVSAYLVPVDDSPVPLRQHETFLAHMAALHAAFWDGGPELEIVPTMHRYLELSPWTAAAERAAGGQALVPRLIAEGWPRLAEVAPEAAAVVTPLALDPGPLVEALETTPQTLVMGNWKLDNLGTDPEGRTILLDWEMPGRGPALTDLVWYLAINCRRLPHSKEEAIATYRRALEECGIATGNWWDRQLALSLLGGLVQFGWEKALGGYDEELAWWEARALAGARVLAAVLSEL
jgi:Phosphotransferase enzyme family